MQYMISLTGAGGVIVVEGDNVSLGSDGSLVVELDRTTMAVLSPGCWESVGPAEAPVVQRALDTWSTLQYSGARLGPDDEERPPQPTEPIVDYRPSGAPGAGQHSQPSTTETQP